LSCSRQVARTSLECRIRGCAEQELSVDTVKREFWRSRVFEIAGEDLNIARNPLGAAGGLGRRCGTHL
jgi:hypothetical protein